MQNIVTLGEINDALKIAAVTAAQLEDMGFAALANKPICEGLPPEESRRLRNAKLYPAESIGQIRVALAQRFAQPAAAADVPASGAAALSEYLKTCEQHAIVPDVGGAFASAFAAGFNLATSQAAQPEATAAIKTLQNLGYTYHGAELWKPPIGKVPDFDLIDSLRNRISELEASQAAPAAVPVVLPEPDAVISELMGLVDEWGMESHLRGEAELDAQHSEATQEEIDCAKDRASKERAAWKAIESKLRALLATATGLPAQAVPAFCHVASLKLKSLQERGYQITGYALEKPVEGAQPERGFINHGGFVGWWWDGQSPQAQADAQDAQLLAFAVSEIRRDEMTDSALLDAMEQNRIAVVPEYEGPWDAEIYNDEGKPNHRGSGSTPREAIRAAIAAQAAQGGE